jgi:hypothetical protein
MARGWESKSVESQIDDAKTQHSEGKPPLTDGEKHAKRERQNLILARARVLHLLDTSANERYKELLRKELSELEKKISPG